MLSDAQKVSLLSMTKEQLICLLDLAVEGQDKANANMQMMIGLLQEADKKMQEQASALASLEAKNIALEARCTFEKTEKT